MKKVLFFIFLCILGINCFKLTQFPLLPAKFSEAFSFYESQWQTNTTGKCWYDSSSLSTRFQFQGSTAICKYIYPDSADCTILIINQTGYMILPTKNLCCQRPTDMPIERDLFDFLSYKGEKTIDNVVYDYWLYSGQAVFPPTKYWTQKGQKRVPRRFVIGNDTSYQMLDFWSSSYNETFDSKSVFSVPANCSRQCAKSIFQE